jgi:hypothetical protein
VCALFPAIAGRGSRVGCRGLSSPWGSCMVASALAEQGKPHGGGKKWGEGSSVVYVCGSSGGSTKEDGLDDAVQDFSRMLDGM